MTDDQLRAIIPAFQQIALAIVNQNGGKAICMDFERNNIRVTVTAERITEPDREGRTVLYEKESEERS